MPHSDACPTNWKEVTMIGRRYCDGESVGVPCTYNRHDCMMEPLLTLLAMGNTVECGKKIRYTEPDSQRFFSLASINSGGVSVTYNDTTYKTAHLDLWCWANLS